MSEPPSPRDSRELREAYRRKAATGGLRAVLDPGDEDGRKNAYLDQVHRRALRRFLPLLGSRVADLGCGIGRLTELLADATSVVALDASPELLVLARERLGRGTVLARADLATLPVASGSLTGALMAFVSLHFDDDTAHRAFREVGRVLQPGGVFLVLEHVAPGEETVEYHGVLDRSSSALAALFDDAGFDIARRVALKKSPSRSVHWVKCGLPRVLWGFGAWVDRCTATRSLAHADYVECLYVARRRGGVPSGVGDLPGVGESLLSLVVPPRWLRHRDR